MNTLWIVVIGAVTIYLAYNFYAKKVDRDVIQSDAKRATPAKMYMDGVDFMPTSRNVLYGYHFKSIAAAGPIVGVITAANLWGWLPALLWLVIGVSFIGWASDYSAIMVSVRNDGNSLSAISHRLIAPRTRTVLFVFIFFYLLLIAGAFIGILAAIFAARPDVPFGIIVLALMGLAAGYMMYRMKMGLITVTAIVVVVTLAAMILGPLGNKTVDGKPVYGPVSSAIVGLNTAVNNITGGRTLFTVVDPTNADPRIPAADAKTGERPKTATYDPATKQINTLPSYIFWTLFLFVFSYLGANLAIWRFAQPVNYIGFWITLLTIGLSAIGAILAPLTGATTVVAGETAAIAKFALPAVKDLGFTLNPTAAWQPLWPMLFVTIACGAISGWHALFGSVGTARQLEYETDGLPVGGGAMFSENTLALLSLVAVSIPGAGGGGGRFAAGVGRLLNAATFGALPEALGTALGFGAFVVIVLTVTQLVFRVMRVTLTEWVGESVPAVRNMHVSTIISMVLTLALVLTGTWVYLWQMFGASNQLMAALSLLVVTVWLKSTNRNPAYALYPMLFMYVTTIFATLVTARNLYVTIASNPNLGGLPVAGAWAMIIVSALLIVAAIFIGWDGWKAYQRYSKGATPTRAAAKAGD
ncbi:MAG TPA: carbon starvation CstA family protein [Anaerolineales bacterium]|nr:carbon starvation CstA family protein [Anaerolineales bacterium]